VHDLSIAESIYIGILISSDYGYDYSSSYNYNSCTSTNLVDTASSGKRKSEDAEDYQKRSKKYRRSPH